MIPGIFQAPRVCVSDLDASLAFYRSLGFTEHGRLEFANPDGIEVVLADSSGRPCLLLLAGDVLSIAPARAPFIIHVPDMKAAFEELSAAGWTVPYTPIFADLLPTGAMHVLDPDGNDIELIMAQLETFDYPAPGEKWEVADILPAEMIQSAAD